MFERTQLFERLCALELWSVRPYFMLRMIWTSAAVHHSHDFWVEKTPVRYRLIPPVQAGSEASARAGIAAQASETNRIETSPRTGRKWRR